MQGSVGEKKVIIRYEVPRTHPSWELEGASLLEPPHGGVYPKHDDGRGVWIVYDVPTTHPSWILTEDTMPESVTHNRVVTLLYALLAAFVARVGRGEVFRNMAVRWDEETPNVGVDPDVSFFDPAPPDARRLRSVRTWQPGHVAPRVAIEVVSETNPRKDYTLAPERYGACGVEELWVFDPLLSGPEAYGGPHRIQLWTRKDGALERVYRGEGPVFSHAMNAWLVVVDGGESLRLSDDEAGERLWLTDVEEERRAKEEERRAKEEERRAKEEERHAKEAALARVAELEAQLATRRS